MKQKPQNGRLVRIPDAILERGNALIPALTRAPLAMGLRWNETAVARLAMSRGLDVLEAELAGYTGDKA